MLLGKNSSLLDEMRHRLPTNTLSNTKRIHRWGNFIAGFSIEFVEQCLLDSVPRPETGLIIDPFSGCGTTLIAAKNLGFSVTGYELHPIFHSIASGKLQHYTVEVVEKVLNSLKEEAIPFSWSNDAVKFLSKLFTEDNLYQISLSVSNLKKISPHLQNFSVVMFLKACELSCRSQTDGIYKAPTSTKKHLPFTIALEQVAAELLDDIDSYWYRHHWIHTPDTQVIRESSVSMKQLRPNSVHSCITSPPYLNNFDYAEMTRMHLYLLGWCSSWKSISETVRNHLITNTTTALKGKKLSAYQVVARDFIPQALLTDLHPIVDKLAKERVTRAGKKEYDYLVYPYYSELFQVIKNIFLALQPGGTVHWVVGDAALYGVHIETHEHTALIMREIGFQDVKINFLRKRGHRWILSKRDGSQKDLGEYHIEARKWR
jgi:DNA modification methylase